MILHFNTLSAENRNTLVSQKRVQNYCFYLTYANIFVKKMQKKCIFFVTRWLSVVANLSKKFVNLSHCGKTVSFRAKTAILALMPKGYIIYNNERACARDTTRRKWDNGWGGRYRRVRAVEANGDRRFRIGGHSADGVRKRLLLVRNADRDGGWAKKRSNGWQLYAG